MKEKLQENRDKIAPTAYKKSMEAAIQLENLFSVSDKMLRVIACVFDRLEEVTPLMLQKLLYFIQGNSLALREKPIAELPWKIARKGYGDGIPSNEMISIESIESYYKEKNVAYNFSSEEGIKNYIRDMLQ